MFTGYSDREVDSDNNVVSNITSIQEYNASASLAVLGSVQEDRLSVSSYGTTIFTPISSSNDQDVTAIFIPFPAVPNLHHVQGLVTLPSSRSHGITKISLNHVDHLDNAVFPYRRFSSYQPLTTDPAASPHPVQEQTLHTRHVAGSPTTTAIQFLAHHIPDYDTTHHNTSQHTASYQNTSHGFTSSLTIDTPHSTSTTNSLLDIAPLNTGPSYSLTVHQNEGTASSDGTDLDQDLTGIGVQFLPFQDL